MSAEEDQLAHELQQTLIEANRRNPDAARKIVDLSDRFQLPLDTVERNEKKLDDRDKLSRLPDAGELTRDHPATAEFLRDRRNAAVAVDDVDTLTQLEDDLQGSEHGFWSNTVRGAVSRTNELVGNLIQLPGTISDDIRSLDLPDPGIRIGEDGISWHWDLPEDTTSAFTVMGRYLSEGDAHRAGYKPRFTWERLKGDVTPTNLAGYAIEQGIKSLPDMAATIATLPAYIASRTEEIAESRAANNLSTVDTGDLAASIVTATVVSLLERIGAKSVFDVGSVATAKQLGKAVGGAVVKEAGTEFLQEGLEYYGETVGTARPVSHLDALDRAFAGAVASGPFGGGIRGVTGTAQLLANRTVKRSRDIGRSMQEQEQLDRIVSLAQGSRTNERAQDRFRTFLQGAGRDRSVYVPSAVVDDLVAQGHELPTYLTDQAAGHPDGDVFIPMDRFGTEIVTDPELLAAVRPHARLSAVGLSSTELSDETNADVEGILAAAQAHQDLKTQADEVFERVRDQLVATGRQSDETARYSAALYPAMATRLAHDYGITIEDAFRAMNFNVTGPGVTAPPGAASLSQELQNDVQFWSALERSVDTADMQEWKKPDGTAKGSSIWAKLQPGKSAGVKKAELRPTGLEEYLHPYASYDISPSTYEPVEGVGGVWAVGEIERPANLLARKTFKTEAEARKFIKGKGEVKFTREQVLDFVKTNGVRLEEQVAGQTPRRDRGDDDQTEDAPDIEWPSFEDGDVLDDVSYWENWAEGDLEQLRDAQNGEQTDEWISEWFETWFNDETNDRDWLEEWTMGGPNAVEATQSERAVTEIVINNDPIPGSNHTRITAVDAADRNVVLASRVVESSRAVTEVNALVRQNFQNIIDERGAYTVTVEDTPGQPDPERVRQVEEGNFDALWEDEDFRKAISNAAEDDFTTMAYDNARQSYLDDNPYRRWSVDVDGIDVEITGSEDAGYSVWVDGRNVDDGTVYSYDEALVQATTHLSESHGVDVGMGDQSRGQWGQYVADGDRSQYREQKIILGSHEGDAYKHAHFPEENMVVFNRLTSRGSELRLEEMQSDWASSARKAGGFKEDIPAVDQEEFQALEQLIESQIAQAAESTGIVPYVGDARSRSDEFYRFLSLSRSYLRHADQYQPTDEQYRPIIESLQPFLNQGLQGLHDELVEMEDRRIAQTTAPAWMPYGGNDWTPLGLKYALIEAIGGGYKTLAWNDNRTLQTIWSPSKDYHAQYNQRMVSTMKKLTGQKARHLTLDGEPYPEQPDTSGWTVEETNGVRTLHDENGEYLTQTSHGAERITDTSLIQRALAAFQPQGKWVIDITPELTNRLIGDGFPLLQSQLGMYSAVERATEKLKIPEWKQEGGRAQGSVIWAKLQPGKAANVTGEEIKWLGLEEFLHPYAGADISFDTHEVVEDERQESLDDAAVRTGVPLIVNNAVVHRAEEAIQRRPDDPQSWIVEKHGGDLSTVPDVTRDIAERAIQLIDARAAPEKTGKFLVAVKRDVGEHAVVAPVFDTTKQAQKFIKSGGQMRFTRDEVLNFINRHGVEIEETVAEESYGPNEDSVEWVEKAWEDPEAWSHVVKDKQYEYNLGNYKEAGYDPESEWLPNNFEEFFDDYDGGDLTDEERSDIVDAENVDELRAYFDRNNIDFDEALRQAAEKDATKDFEKTAKTDYFEDPMYIYESNEIDDLMIFGNDDIGYDVRTSMHFSSVVSTGISSVEEAQIQALDYARDQGLIEGADEPTTAKFGPQGDAYLDESEPADVENYWEYKLSLPGIDADFRETAHFDEPNIVAFLRVSERMLPRKPTPDEIEEVRRSTQALIDEAEESLPTNEALIQQKESSQQAVKDFVARVSEEAGKNVIAEHDEHRAEALQFEQRLNDFTAWESILNEIGGYTVGEMQAVEEYRAMRRRMSAVNQRILTLRNQPGPRQTAKAFFIDEAQSDWATGARKRGVQTGRPVTQLRQEEAALIVELDQVFGDIFDNLKDVQDVSVQLPGRSLNRSDFAQFAYQIAAHDDGSATEPEGMREVVSTQDGWADAVEKVNRLNDTRRERVAEEQGVPNAPFMGDSWLRMSMKRGLILAAQQGFERFAWIDAAAKKEMWGKDFTAQYDDKMPSIVKKLTHVQPEHFDNDGDRIDELDDRDPDESFPGYWSIELTPELREQILTEAFPIYQPQEDKPSRGQFFPDSRQIKLTAASDLSSFLHETAHLFLEVEKQFAQTHGPRAHHAELLKFLGAEDWSDIDPYTPAGVERHEKFARGFEAYLFEGKAPSLSLRDAFSAFRRWLTQVYQSILDLNVELNDEVRGVFDRMLATEVEIAEASANPAYDQYFESPEAAGMTPEQWETYQNQVTRRTEAATVGVTAKAVQQYVKRRTAEWNEERALLVDEERERLSGTPVYMVLAEAAEYPMNRDQIVEALGEQPSKRLNGKLIGRATRSEEAVDPQLYAEKHGFDSVRSMMEQIEAAPGIKAAATDAAQQRMIEKYGDIINDGTLEAEAREALHSEEQAKLLLMELAQLKPRGLPTINREYLKAEARRLIATMRYREINPSRYYRAEIRAAQRAERARGTDMTAEAYDAKVQQLTNHYLYREATEARATMERHRRHVRQVQSRTYDLKQVDTKYIRLLKTTANLYFLKNRDQQQADIDKILDWYTAQLQVESDVRLMDENLVLAIEAKDRGEFSEFRLPEFDDLTADQLRGVYEMLRHLRFVGGKLGNAQAAEIAAERRSLVESIDEHGGRNVKDPETPHRAPSNWDFARFLANTLPSLRNMIRKLDGTFEEPIGGREGSAEKLIWRRVEEGFNKRLEIGEKLYELFNEALTETSRIALSRKDLPTIVSDKGHTLRFNEEEAFMLGLYWGTETSRDAIREGHGMTDADVMKVLANLTPEQLGAINSIWSIHDNEVWPMLSTASIDRYGVAPTKLDPVPFEVNGVKMTGGHMRLFYNSVELKMRAEDDAAGHSNSVVPDKAGSLHERVGSGGKPVLLDKNNILRSIEENAHFIAFAEPAKHVSRLIDARDVASVIQRKHGEPFYTAFHDLVASQMRGKPAAQSRILAEVGKVARYFRRVATAKYLLLSIRNVVQQFSVIPAVAQEIGRDPARLANTIAHIAFNRSDVIGEIQTKSAFMRNRTRLVNREASETIKQLSMTSGIERAHDIMGRVGFMPQTAVDALFAYPIWLVRYEQEIEAHGDHVRAVSNADTSVAETVGSGSDLHLSSAFNSNNPELVKALTVFGSYFNSYYQRMYSHTNGFTKARPAGIATLTVVPWLAGVLTAVLIVDLPGEDGDEDWWKWHMRSWGSFVGGTVPLFADVVSMYFSGFGAETPLATAAKTVPRLPAEIGAYIDEEQSALKTTSDVIKVGSTFFPAPGSGQLTRMLDYVDSYNQGKEGDFSAYQMMTEGPDKN